MATVKCKNTNNFYITVTYETGAGYFKITKITGYYSAGKAGDCTKDYAHEVYNGDSKLGTVTSYKGSYASGNGYGWLASTSSPWVWNINNPSFSASGSVTLKIKIKGSIKTDTVFTAESAFNVSPATGVLDVNPYINGVEYASGSSGFTFNLSGKASASNKEDYYDGAAAPGSYTATPNAKTGYTTTASSGTLAAGGSLTLTPKWQINTYTVIVRRDSSSRITDITNPAWGWTDGYKKNTVNYGTSLTFNVSLATGYHFTKWSGSNTSTTRPLTVTITGNYDITANSAANTYTVVYNGNSNTGGSTASSSHTYDTAKNLTANGFTRTGYSFAGWATTSSGSVAYADKASVKNLTSTDGGTVNLYAKWTLNKPGGVTVGCTKTTRTKMYVTAGETSGVSITNRTVYYRVNGSTGSYSSISLGTGTSGTITGLQPNTTYQIYSKVTNAAGGVDSSTSTFTTMANPPKNLVATNINTKPFTTDVQVSGNGDTNAGISNYTIYWCKKPSKPIHDMAIKYFENALWARVFYHQCNEGTTLFTSLAEAKNTQTADKYSRLYLLDDNTYKGSDGKFEFMLTYPNDKGYTQYNRWKQTNAPQKEFTARTTPQTVTGYSGVHIDWTANYWGGLERFQTDVSAFATTYIDGSVGHGNWFYAIGAANTHGYGIPSYDSTSSIVELWVRIDDQAVSSKSLGTATTGSIANLEEETDYIVWAQATNIGGIQSGAATAFTTPVDQAKIRIKKDGAWKKGKAFFKQNGTWVKAKKIYMKIDGKWVINYNFDPGERK